MAKKIQVSLSAEEARALMNSRSETGSKASERELEAVQLKLADAVLKTNHGR